MFQANKNSKICTGFTIAKLINFFGLIHTGRPRHGAGLMSLIHISHKTCPHSSTDTGGGRDQDNAGTRATPHMQLTTEGSLLHSWQQIMFCEEALKLVGLWERPHSHHNTETD